MVAGRYLDQSALENLLENAKKSAAGVQ